MFDIRSMEGWIHPGRCLLLLAVVGSLLTGCGNLLIEASSSDYNPFLSDILPSNQQTVGDARGTAIMDPVVLRELDLRESPIDKVGQIGFGVGRMLNPGKLSDAPLSNEELFALPSMTLVRKVLDDEFYRYNARGDEADTGRLSIFHTADLYSRNSRFVLTGVVNRMDRAYLSPTDCGEIRLLYHLTGGSGARAQETAATSPGRATLNIVMKAKAGAASWKRGPVTCSDIAQRWLAVGDSSLTGVELATKLMSKGEPLELVKVANIDRIEFNIQIARAPKGVFGEARADYLLKVFHYNARSKVFEDGPMENQLDRERILASDDLKRDFRQWLLEPNQIRELDSGTILIPKRFLTNSVIAATPVERLDLGPAAGFVKDDKSNGAVFKENDVVAALKRATDSGIMLQNLRSVENFEQRLNDVTCSGCHQTRGVGGFHFPGRDWMTTKTAAPASPHFFADQPRRRAILIALRDGSSPDYSRGFSNTSQVRADQEFAKTGE